MLQSCMVNSKISHKFSVYFPHDFCCFLRKMAAISKQNLSKQIVAYGPCARFDCFYVPDHHVSVSPKAARVAGGPSVQVPFWAILTGHPFFPFLRNFEAQTVAGFPVLRVTDATQICSSKHYRFENNKFTLSYIFILMRISFFYINLYIFEKERRYHSTL